ncbi:DUF3726 domain-containing protein [Psychrobacter sp. ANT_WB68]|uniref:DUF3726 domain-containing protein n=1 Tax=Psychrobacter sp. ANT_WB68 TaxID=2597355 RepID=UPI0011F1AE18|nr:DUF3726 domain-containing protein [Psychrobacter sp. ANT_WB68]KAA0914557.1 DUF3726 domain-containing protein [Psychrobacter sp. ANT_WB68]
MIVSHNEIVTMVNKAFLGLQREVGEADLIASMVAELQMAGLNGITHFNNASPFILSERDEPIDIVHQADGEVSLDLHGSSLVCHLPAVMDYAIEKMGDHDHFKIYLHDCHNRWLAYSELVNLAAKGIACLAKWDNGTAPKHTIFTLDKRFVYPDLYFFNEAQDNYNTNDMVIELSTANFDIEQEIQNFDQKVSMDELFETHKRAWKEGIYVDDEQWAILKKSAAAILVENSEASSKGAGGI